MKTLVKFIHEERGNVIFMKSLSIVPTFRETIIINKVKYIIIDKEFDLDEEGEVVRLIVTNK